MSEGARAQLRDEVLSLLARMHELLGQLPENSPYRKAIERHRRRLEDSIGQLEAIGDEPD
jgi:hypothetical protein